MRLHRQAREERGAVAVMVAILSTVLLLAAAFAIDLGMQRVARSDVQALVDVVSLDLARDLDGVSTPQYFDTKWATSGSTMQQSLQRNSTGLGSSTGASAPWICTTNACVTAVAGHLDSSGVFQAYATSDNNVADTPTAVQVSAQASVAFGLGSVTGTTSGAVNRSAVAIGVPASTTTPMPVSSSSSACVVVGSYLLRASLGTSPLLNGLIGNALVGNNVSATLVGYQGVATAQVNVGKLVADTTLGTVSSPLSTSVTLGTLLTAIANASPSSAQASISTFRTLVSAAGKLNLSVGPVANILSVNNSGALANATVTAGDLLAGAASFVNGNTFATTGVSVTLGGISMTAKVKVIQRPQIGCYPNPAKTGQVQVQLTGSVGVLVSLENITVTLGLAQAQATASTLTCNGWTPSALGVVVSNQAVATAEVDDSLLGLINGLGSQVSIGSNAPSLVSLALPTYYDPNFYPVSQTSTTLLSTSGLLGTILGVVGSVNSALSSVTNTVTTQLGVNLAGADIAAERTPSCITPSLAG